MLQKLQGTGGTLVAILPASRRLTGPRPARAQRFKIKSILKEKPFYVAEVEEFPDEPGAFPRCRRCPAACAR